MDFGILHMSMEQPAALAASAWTDWPAHRWMLVACAFIILFLLREIGKLFGVLAGCLVRSRGNLEIEHSLSTARSRNNVALLLGLVFLVVADRYNLYNPSFIAPWSEPWLRFGELTGVAAAYLLLRRILHSIILGIGHKRMNSEACSAVRHGLFNYFICFMLLSLPTICLVCIFNLPDNAARMILWAELALLWLVALTREYHILQSNFSGLPTILYLCGLEIIPAGALVACGLMF